MSNDYDYLFKLLLIGDSGVGKVRPTDHVYAWKTERLQM